MSSNRPPAACSRVVRPRPRPMSKPRSRPPAGLQPAWAATSVDERARLLEPPCRSARSGDSTPWPRSNRATTASRSSLARQVDIPRAVANLRFFASAITPVGQRVACRQRRLDQHHPAPATRRGRLHLALEPAALPVHLEDRAGAGRRQHGRRQTVGDHAVHGGPAWRAGAWRPAFPPACSTSSTATAPKSARPSSSTPRSRRFRSPAARAPGRPSRPPRRRCSRSSRSRWAARIRPSSSPTSISAMPTWPRSCVRDSPTRARSACADRACWCSVRSTSRFATRYLDAVRRTARRRPEGRHERSRRAGLAAHFDKVVGAIARARERGWADPLRRQGCQASTGAARRDGSSNRP